MEIKLIYVIGHLVGVALGAGGAVMSDLMFFTSIKDKKISKTELTFLGLGSTLVWVGLFLLIFSGLGLFLSDTEKYLHSSKFIAKMAIVGVIFVNGLLFHWRHLPLLEKYSGKYLYKSRNFMKNTNMLIISGVVSIVSWMSALVLGSLRSVSYTYQEVLLAYVLIVVVVSCVMIQFKSKLFKKKKSGR